MPKHSVAAAFAILLCLAPALAQEREWTFNTDETDAFLVFGVPESDDLGISFACTMGSGDVRVVIAETNERVAPNGRLRIEFAIGGETFGFDGTSQPNEDAGVPSAEAVIAANGPVFAALAAADRFAVKIAGGEDTFPLAGADFPAFRRVCSKT